MGLCLRACVVRAELLLGNGARCVDSVVASRKRSRTGAQWKSGEYRFAATPSLVLAHTHTRVLACAREMCTHERHTQYVPSPRARGVGRKF
eukprot:4228201-Prymnesium_polylepis.1